MKKILMTGGGSAGHVIPNLALLPKLSDHYKVCYAGTNGIEFALLKDKGVPFYTFSAPKLVRGSLFRNLTLPLCFLQSVRQAKHILKDARPDLVFSKGGYVSLPVVIAAKKLGIPAVSHESDFSAGLANKIIAKRCALVLTSFPETAASLPNGMFSGSPVREELFGADPAKAREKYGFDGGKPVLLVFGGGSGSAAINRAIDQSLPALLKEFDILHIRGNSKNSTQFHGYVPLNFEQDMASAYACSDYVVSRAGSNTVFEILALKKRALLIPLENGRSRGDQVENAHYFKERGLCHVLREKDLSAQSLQKALHDLTDDHDLPVRLARAPFHSGNGVILSEIMTLLKD